MGTKKIPVTCFRHPAGRTALTTRPQSAIASPRRKWLVFVEFAGYLSNLVSKKNFFWPSSQVPQFVFHIRHLKKQSHPARPSPMKKPLAPITPLFWIAPSRKTDEHAVHVESRRNAAILCRFASDQFKNLYQQILNENKKPDFNNSFSRACLRRSSRRC